MEKFKTIRLFQEGQHDLYIQGFGRSRNEHTKKKKVNKQKTIKGNKNEKKKILTFPHIYSCISRLVCSTLSEKKKKLEKYLLRCLYWLQL